MLSQQHSRATHPLIEGDIVFDIIHDRASKWDALFDGPYGVIASLRGHEVRIWNLGSFEERVVHWEFMMLLPHT